MLFLMSQAPVIVAVPPELTWLGRAGYHSRSSFAVKQSLCCRYPLVVKVVAADDAYQCNALRLLDHQTARRATQSSNSIAVQGVYTLLENEPFCCQ